MTIVYACHITPNGDKHEGMTADCPKCRRAKRRPRTANKAADRGRKGGQTSEKKKNPPRKCASCAKPISRKNKSGFCITCYNAQRAISKPAELKYNRKCLNPDCPSMIRPYNKSGLCLSCYRNADVWRAYKKHQQEWAELANNT